HPLRLHRPAPRVDPAQGVDRLRALPQAARLRRGRDDAGPGARRLRGSRAPGPVVRAAHAHAGGSRRSVATHHLVSDPVAMKEEATVSAAPEHLVDLIGLDRGFVLELFAEADRLRAVRGTPKAPRPLSGRTAALVFHKPSLRTRVSFTVGMHELGGDAVDLGAAAVSEHGRGSVEDVAPVLSGMVDLVVVRTFSHRLVQRLASYATIPVINALTDHSHPCQILADLYTLWRAGRDLDHMKVAWVGDGNN